MLLNDATLTRTVNTALRNCIKAHGDISTRDISSASKRIVNAIEGVLCELCRQDLQKKVEPGLLLVEKKQFEQTKKKLELARKTIKYWAAKAEKEKNREN